MHRHRAAILEKKKEKKKRDRKNTHTKTHTTQQLSSEAFTSVKLIKYGSRDESVHSIRILFNQREARSFSQWSPYRTRAYVNKKWRRPIQRLAETGQLFRTTFKLSHGLQLVAVILLVVVWDGRGTANFAGAQGHMAYTPDWFQKFICWFGTRVKLC